MKRLIIPALAAVLLVAACGCRKSTVRRSQMGEPNEAPTTQPVADASSRYDVAIGRRGGRLVMATISAPKSFNPITSGETTTSDYTQLIFLGLTKNNPWTYQVEPELATSWSHDDSGLVWTVKLRQDVTWSDGAAFTADDVVFTYGVIYDQRWTCSTRDIITGPNGEAWKVEAVDPHTVRFTLFDRNAIFPLLIATEIIPRHKYQPLVEAGRFNEALGVGTEPRDIVGTGPFLLSSYETDSKVVMKRNPRYYKRDAAGSSLPYLEELVFLVVADLDVQMLKFRQREIDLTGLRGQDFPVFNPLQAEERFTIYKLGPNTGSEFVFFNLNTGTNPKTGEPYVEPRKLKWFRDVRFRRAVSHAVDRPFIVKSIMNGLGYPQYGPMNHASGWFYCNADAPRYAYDPARARALLAEMGLMDRDGDGVLEDAEGVPVSFNLTTNTGNTVRMRIAETIRKDLEALGMRVNYRPMNFNTLVSSLDYTYDWEACVMGLTGGPEPHWGANVWKSSGRMHMWFPDQPTPSTEWEAEIDRLFAEGVRELDLAKRREIYFRWQEIVGREQPLVYTAAPERLLALRNRFGNVFPAPFGGVLHNVEEVYVLESE